MQLARIGVAVVVLAVAPSSARADGPWRVLFDTLAYTDTDNVMVASPQLGVSRDLDEDGGRATARVVADAISAASVDVISQATTRFQELRTEVDLAAAKALGDQLPSLGYRFSVEPDYQSHGARAGWQSRLGSSDTTLAGGYGFTRDRIGRAGTPMSTFGETLWTHAASLSLTQVLGPNTLVRAVGSFTYQSGYMEKPYRFVPLVDMNGALLATRPPEEVPDRRYRGALAVRALRYHTRWRASFKVDYQLYADNWGVVAHMAEPSLRKEIGERIRLAGKLRVYRQGAASFWERSYRVAGEGVLPRWRTADRSLSPYTSGSAGLRFEIDVWSVSAYIEGIGMYTKFHDYALLDDRVALIAQTGVRWTP